MAARINTLPPSTYMFNTRSHDDQHDIEEPESPVDGVRPGSIDSIKLRPDGTRSVTDPPPSALLQSYFSTASSARLANIQRNRSPYSRTHLRSRSSGAALSAPTMTRAHSSPAVHSAARAPDLTLPAPASLTPSSPMRSPARQRSPLRPAEETSHSSNPPQRSPSWIESARGGGAIEAIQEDSELDLTPRQTLPTYGMPFARSSSLRRRPASPLHSVTNAVPPTSAPSSGLENSSTSSGSNSPALGPQRFNETMPPLNHYASASSFSSLSSFPSTPTSQRSRSPSISSLDTIEDAPDMEQEAIEAERIEKLKLAAERADNSEDDDDNSRRRSSLDQPRGFGFSRGGSRERKRWSVCGGERRVDLDLDTIWED
ncbi:hypothetical protein CB0940_00388 [Cercospora beticola]|uniref:Basic proline-rich protein n=1 Tax=Cercospora beticola TaxID=122368 RepID=A0A2G5I8K8_CERBT|nr:hypothetical protein CB0940_00388 [Cercospora beticola]PIB01119.1 hypothetical protein CB0940_00388 [Cercospora beticola]WPA95804.1 hypothetical protein RHO25_000407 [Cercospora beticola]CAK1355941.1 unnamed protein product [Cercospora beticola]